MPPELIFEPYDVWSYDQRLAYDLLGDRADHKDVALIREFRRRAEARVARRFQDWMDNLPHEPSFEKIMEHYTNGAPDDLR